MSVPRPGLRARARLADAARLLPVLGIILLILPYFLFPTEGMRVLWLAGLFGAWAALIALTALVARRHAALEQER